MNALIEEGIVLRETVALAEISDNNGTLVQIRVTGRVLCAYQVVLIVNKRLAVQRDSSNRQVVRGIAYEYHAFIRTTNPRRALLRYDDSHDMLHRHFFDSNGKELERSPRSIPLDSLPRMDLVIREAVALAGGPALPEEWMTRDDLPWS